MKHYNALDFETTGINPLKDRIVSWAVITMTEEKVTQKKHGIINPEIPIPPEATKIHGITNKDVQQHGETPPKALKKIMQTITNGLPLVIFNAQYDLTMLVAELKRHNLPGKKQIQNLTIIDPLVIDRALDRRRSGPRRLRNVAEFYGVPLVNAHSATEDAIAAAQIAWKQRLTFTGEFNNLQELQESQVIWCGKQKIAFAKFMRSRREEFIGSLEWPFYEEETS